MVADVKKSFNSMIHKIKTFDLTKNEKMFCKQQYNTKFFLNVEYVVRVLCVNSYHKHWIIFLFKSIFLYHSTNGLRMGLISCSAIKNIYQRFF